MVHIDSSSHINAALSQVNQIAQGLNEGTVRVPFGSKERTISISVEEQKFVNEKLERFKSGLDECNWDKIRGAINEVSPHFGGGIGNDLVLALNEASKGNKTLKDILDKVIQTFPDYHFDQLLGGTKEKTIDTKGYDFNKAEDRKAYSRKSYEEIIAKSKEASNLPRTNDSENQVIVGIANEITTLLADYRTVSHDFPKGSEKNINNMFYNLGKKLYSDYGKLSNNEKYLLGNAINAFKDTFIWEDTVLRGDEGSLLKSDLDELMNQLKSDGHLV